MFPVLRLSTGAWTRCLAGISTTAPVDKGHSKWQNIREVKGKNDAVRSQKISFFLRKVKTAVKHGGFDPKFNKSLANLQADYKSQSLPIDTLNKYLAKIKDKPDVTTYYDLIGPSGSFIIIEAETDSVNRTRNTIQKYIKKVGTIRFAPQSLRSRFEEKGFIIVGPKRVDGLVVDVDQLEEVGIELDCEEVLKVEDREEGPVVELTVPPTKLHSTEGKLTDLGYLVEDSQLKLVPIHRVSLSPDESAVVEKFYELVGEDEDVTQVFDNFELVDDEEEQKARAS